MKSTDLRKTVWGRFLRILGVTLTVVVKDQSGVLRVNNTSYLIVAQSGSGTTPAWQLDTSENLDPNAKRLYTNAMANGQIAVAVLPHLVGTTPFEQLSMPDKMAVVNLFKQVAFNVPTGTDVSSAQTHAETYGGQTLNFGYDPASGIVRTRYTIETKTDPTSGKPLPTYQIMYPAQYANLMTAEAPTAGDITLYDFNYDSPNPRTRVVLTTPSLLRTSITPVPFTATFNRPVPGLDAKVVFASTGTVTGFQTADGGRTYTFAVSNPQPGALVVYIPPIPSANTAQSDTLPLIIHSQPTVIGVTAGVPDGTYGAGAVIPIRVQFSAPVTVTGNPQLTLATGGGLNNALLNYDGGSGTDTLTFAYTVAPGQNTAHLDYFFNGALALNGAIFDGSGQLLQYLILPDPGAPGSLGSNSNIVVNTSPQGTHVVNVSTTAQSPGSYGPGDSIAIGVQFSDLVNVDTTNGTPRLLLNSGGAATYSGGTGTNVLTFTYTVQVGESSPLPDYASASALDPAGATVRDGSGADANLTLPAPGAPGSLESNAALTVRGTSPRVIRLPPARTVRSRPTPRPARCR
jgi:hypothetical protein